PAVGLEEPDNHPCGQADQHTLRLLSPSLGSGRRAALSVCAALGARGANNVLTPGSSDCGERCSMIVTERASCLLSATGLLPGGADGCQCVRVTFTLRSDGWRRTTPRTARRRSAWKRASFSVCCIASYSFAPRPRGA